MIKDKRDKRFQGHPKRVGGILDWGSALGHPEIAEKHCCRGNK